MIFSTPGRSAWCVNAAEEKLQRETGMLERMRQQEISEGVRSREERTWRLEPVGDTKVDLDGEGRERKRMKDIPKKEETAEGTNLGGSERRRKEIEVCLVKWIGLEYREEVHEKIQGHVGYLLWD